jgi:hypothetical protein
LVLLNNHEEALTFSLWTSPSPHGWFVAIDTSGSDCGDVLAAGEFVLGGQSAAVLLAGEAAMAAFRAELAIAEAPTLKVKI